MPFVIALTGGIGSGKSSVAEKFAELGACVVDTDAIARRLTAPGHAGAVKIGEQFGAHFLKSDGSLDRARMRDLVFADPAAKKNLEAILHPMIRAEVDAAVRSSCAPYVMLVVPLLVETGAYRTIARRILVIDCSEAAQIARVKQRNGLSEDTVRKIMASQASRAERLAVADDVIANDSDLTALQEHSAALHQRYLELAAAGSGDGKALSGTKKSN